MDAPLRATGPSDVSIYCRQFPFIVDNWGIDRHVRESLGKAFLSGGRSKGEDDFAGRCAESLSIRKPI